MIRWRHLRPGELDHERIWLAVSLCAALIGWAFLASGLPTPRCTWHDLTGFACPGCGSTRSARHLLAGDLRAAFAMNPLFFTGLAGVALYDLYAAVVLALRLPRLRLENIPPWLGHAARITAIAALLANWAWLIVRKV